MIMCLYCGGPLVLLGDLGSVRWCRCRNCGLDQQVDVRDDYDTDEEHEPRPERFYEDDDRAFTWETDDVED